MNKYGLIQLAPYNAHNLHINLFRTGFVGE
jgi:hypothetical protein